VKLFKNLLKNQIVKMEANRVVDLKRIGFTAPLNYDCFFELYKWLGFKECMSLAEAYDGLQCVADLIYRKKFTNFTYDFQDPIERVFYHIGPFVRSLTIVLDNFDYTEHHLKEIRDACKQLQSLTLKGFDRRNVKRNPFRETDNVEILTLDHCALANDDEFFDGFTNLKCLNIVRCGEIDNIALKKCFENNNALTSFVCNGSYRYYPHLLQLLQNLERLCLHYNKRLTANSFSKFSKLRFLTLHCWDENINDILIELSKTNTLEQLELIDVGVDANTFNIINSFKKLELLVVTAHECEFSLPDAMPAKLQTLKLGGFQISQQQITSLTKKLEHLEELHLSDCILDNNGILVIDFNSMTDLVIEALIIQIKTNRQLNVILTHYCGNWSEVIY